MLAGLFFIAIVLGYVGWLTGPTETARPEAPVRKKSAAELARDQRISAATVAAKTIREATRDPKSFKLERAIVTETGAVCIEYRATNAFGAVDKDVAVVPASSTKLYLSGADGFKAAWRKECDRKNGDDVTAQVKQFIDLI